MRAGLLFSAVATAALAAGLDAQGTPANPDSACTKYSDGRVECRVYKRGPGDSTFRNLMFYKMDSAMAKRPALGLELRTTGTKRDTLGVFVEAVTPKGPAELAGIVEGDRIAAINGVDVRVSAADAEDSYASELGSHRLTREVQKLTPGTRVTLRVYSGGRFRDVQVTTGKASEVMRLGNRFDYGMPMGGMMRIDGPGMMRLGPEMQLMRERMPMMKERMEPLLRQRMQDLDPILREQLRDLPDRTQLRTAPRIRISAPERSHRTYRVDRGGGESTVAESPEVFSTDDEAGEGFMLDELSDFEAPFRVDMDDQPFAFDLDEQPFWLDLDDEPFDFETEIAPLSPEEIRELVGITARDARVGLERLAADGIA